MSCATRAQWPPAEFDASTDHSGLGCWCDGTLSAAGRAHALLGQASARSFSVAPLPYALRPTDAPFVHACCVVATARHVSDVSSDACVTRQHLAAVPCGAERALWAWLLAAQSGVLSFPPWAAVLVSCLRERLHAAGAATLFVWAPHDLAVDDDAIAADVTRLCAPLINGARTRLLPAELMAGRAPPLSVGDPPTVVAPAAKSARLEDHY